jgi:cell wall-associated NlpC family hydrolase
VAGRARAARYLSGAVPVNWQEKYVGLPFKDFGRDFKGVDCWGLVRLVLWHECAISVPSYGEISARDLIRVTSTIASESDADPWCSIERHEAKPFDVVLMRGRPMHVGILAPGNRVLHVEERISAVLLPLKHPSIYTRIVGFRRHRELMHECANSL